MSARALRWWTRGALVLILLVAAAARFWGIDYGLPHPIARPDEERIVGRAYHILATGNLHPGTFIYPSLLMYLDTLALGAYFCANKLLGGYDRLFDFLFDAAVLRPALHYRICRAVSALAGVATVAVTYLVARRVSGRRSVALVAAAALAVCYGHVRDAHFSTVDVTMTLFVVLSILFALRAAERPSPLFFLLAGAFAGLATSTKYNAGLVILSAAAAAAASPGSLGKRAVRLAPAGFGLLAAFFVTSPYAILSYPAAIADLKFLGVSSYRGSDLALWTHLETTLPVGLGEALSVAAAVGLARAVYRRRPADLVLLCFFAPFFWLVGSVRIAFPRYLIPVLPLLVVWGAEAGQWAAERLARGRARWAFAAAQATVLAAFVLPGAVRSAAFDRLAARKDTRVLAGEWVAEHLPAQTAILLCRGYGAPFLNEDRRRPPAFRVRTIPCSLDAVEKAAAAYLVTHQHPALAAFSRVPPDLSEWLDRNARALTVLEPFRGSPPRDAFFYPADAFYLPYTRLGSFERGGPVIRIWEIDRPQRTASMEPEGAR